MFGLTNAKTVKEMEASCVEKPISYYDKYVQFCKGLTSIRDSFSLFNWKWPVAGLSGIATVAAFFFNELNRDRIVGQDKIMAKKHIKKLLELEGMFDYTVSSDRKLDENFAATLSHDIEALIGDRENLEFHPPIGLKEKLEDHMRKYPELKKPFVFTFSSFANDLKRVGVKTEYVINICRDRATLTTKKTDYIYMTFKTTMGRPVPGYTRTPLIESIWVSP